jgi:hypothetical protein
MAAFQEEEAIGKTIELGGMSTKGHEQEVALSAKKEKYLINRHKQKQTARGLFNQQFL